MSGEEDDGPGTREVAHRLFAAEFDDADFSYSESDEERAPNYVVTPSGARVNRLFLVSVLTEKEWVNDDMLRARVVDPTGPFVTYAGQYQPDELAFLERVDPPAFLAVTGKARTFQPEDGDRVFTSVRPESISEVDADTRDRWVVEAAKRTADRVGTAAAAMETGLAGEELTAALEADGIDPARASGIALALDHYDTTPAYLSALHELATEALEMVAGERDEVTGLPLAPDEGDGNASALATGEIAVPASAALAGSAAEPSGETPTGSEFEPVSEGTSAEESTAATSESETTTGAEAEPADSSASGATTDDGVGDSTTDTEPGDTGADAGTTDDDLGDFEPDDVEPDDLDDFDPEDDEVLSEAEREQIESEYGTEFSTGDEVTEEPELNPEDGEEDEPAEGPEAAEETEPEAAEETDDDPEPPDTPAPDAEQPAETGDEDEATGAEPAEDVPVDDAVMDAMADLDEGDGAPHDELVAAVADRTGADADAVEAAIEDALMSGQCYEPDDGVLKPI